MTDRTSTVVASDVPSPQGYLEELRRLLQELLSLTADFQSAIQKEAGTPPIAIAELERLVLEQIGRLLPANRKTVCFTDNGCLRSHLNYLPALLANAGINCILCQRGKSTNANGVLSLSMPERLLPKLPVDLVLCPPGQTYPFPSIAIASHHRSITHSLSFTLQNDYCIVSFGNNSEILRDFAKEVAKIRLPADYLNSRKQITLLPVGSLKITRIKLIAERLPPQSKRNILLCPTTSDKVGYLVPKYGIPIIEALLARFPDYQIVFRPFPETRNSAEVKAINDYFSNAPNYEYDPSEDYTQVYAKGAVLITDYSATAHTFSLATLRPSVFFLPPPMDQFATPLSIASKIGASVVTTIPDLLMTVDSVLHHTDRSRSQLLAVRESTVVNPDTSDQLLVSHIRAILDGVERSDWIRLAVPTENILPAAAKSWHIFMEEASARRNQFYLPPLIAEYLHRYREPLPDQLLSSMVSSVAGAGMQQHTAEFVSLFQLLIRALEHTPNNAVTIRDTSTVLREALCSHNAQDLLRMMLAWLRTHGVDFLHKTLFGPALDAYLQDRNVDAFADLLRAILIPQNETPTHLSAEALNVGVLGDDTHYSLLNNFGDARLIRGTPEQVAVWNLTIYNQNSRAVFLHPPAQLAITIPSGARGCFVTAVAIHPDAWQRPDAGGCEFTIRIDDRIVCVMSIDPAHVPADRHWHEIRLSVPESATGRHQLTLETRSTSNSSDNLWALWRAPICAWENPAQQ